MSVASPSHQLPLQAAAHHSQQSQARPPSHRLSRGSPKRAKSTPSPINLGSSTSTPASSASSSTSSSFRQRHRLGHSQAHRQESSASASSSRGLPDSDPICPNGCTKSRRREMSVPLLSQTLSSVTLSQTPSPQEAILAPRPLGPPTAIPFHVPSPSPKLSATPRRPPIAPVNPQYSESWGRDRRGSMTGQVPQLPSFLGSPFHTKSGVRYAFQALSPTRITGQSKFVNNTRGTQLPSDWDTSEWMVEEALDQEPVPELGSARRPAFGLPLPPLRRTPGSTSSIDDYSGSTASSASLLSLPRNSTEAHHRPNVASIWGESGGLGLYDVSQPETPSRPSFHPPEKIQVRRMSDKSLNSPGLSPLNSRSIKSRPGAGGADGEISPLQAFLLGRSTLSTSPPEDATLPIKGQSPFSSFLPRLLSSKKTTRRRGPASPFDHNMDHDGSMEQDLSANLCSPIVFSHRKYGRTDSEKTIGLGFGMDEPINDLHVDICSSPSSESLSIISPSKHLDDGPSRVPVRVMPLSPARASIPRRKTVAGNAKKLSAIGTRQRAALRPSIRRGITEPRTLNTPYASSQSDYLSPAHAVMSTPVCALFGDAKPSPAAFASTGLVKKKKSNIPGLEIPRFGGSEPPKQPAEPASFKPVKSRLSQMAAASQMPAPAAPVPISTDTASSTTLPNNANANSNGSGNGTNSGGVSMYVRAAQRTRGLRRKSSTMFVRHGSSGSIGDSLEFTSGSPLTPTKGPPALRIIPVSHGAATPSPTTPTNVVYPFAPSTSLSAISSPPRKPMGNITESTEISSPAERARASLPSRAHLLRHQGPVARASNPMLAASFRAQEPLGKMESSGAGSRLDTDFVLVHGLGRGEFSQVWKVREKATGNFFAIKAGKPYTGYKNRLRQLEEVSILHQLSLEPHPHIIPFVDSWEHNSRLYIRTPLAPCGDLSLFLMSLSDVGGMGEARVWKVLYELSSGLDYIHSNNFLHLDLKPSNILITSTGSLQIADFGMSTIMTDAGTVGGVSPALPTAVDGEFVWDDQTNGSVPVPSPILDRDVEGDREYMCPEALGGTVGREADVYSLGILILEAALNVVLPSNGDGWVKLRSDDFSDIQEHHVTRGHGRPNLGIRSDSKTTITPGSVADEPAPVELSTELLQMIKSMMVSDRHKRIPLSAVIECAAISKIREMRRAEEMEVVVDENEEENSSGPRARATATRARADDCGRKAGPALAEEDESFLAYILGERE